MDSEQLHFGRYTLDVRRGSLLNGDGAQIGLRPKTFAVLLHLARNPGRLISKNQLFDAVWPNSVVTDDTLVQCIVELRRALGAEGANLIRTVPRRGYRFDAPAPERLAQAPLVSMPAPIPSKVHWLGRAALLAASLACLFIFGDVTDPAGSAPGAARAGARSNATATIAVMPFANRAGDPASDYFSDGLTEDVINALGRFSELTVMSWNAVRPYKGKSTAPADVARRLGVQYQIEGGVQVAGERVRVNTQLVDGKGRVLWSGRFDEALTDIFALHDRITMQVAGALALQVSRFEQHRALTRSPAGLEAYDYVLRARPALQRPTRANNAAARTLLRRALDIDPECAPAYTALAESYHLDVSMGWAESPAAALARAEDMANQALALDPAQSRAHVTLGRIHLFRGRYDRASVELERALAANPSDVRALAGRGNLLLWLGRTDAAVETLERAQSLDPELNAVDRFALSLAYYLTRNYSAAVEQAEQNLRSTPDAGFSRIVLAAAYAQSNRTADALRLAEEIKRLDPEYDLSGFGTKFEHLNDFEQLRDGLMKAGLIDKAARVPSAAATARAADPLQASGR